MNSTDSGPTALEATITVHVDVFRMDGEPRGNTASGHYHFILDKDVVHVDAEGVPTRITYRLTADAVARGFSLMDAYVDDSRFQLRGPYFERRGTDADDTESGDDADDAKARYDAVSFVHSNTHASLISVSLQVRDHRAADRRIAYDPQVTNRPGKNG